MFCDYMNRTVLLVLHALRPELYITILFHNSFQIASGGHFLLYNQSPNLVWFDLVTSGKKPPRNRIKKHLIS